MGFMMEKRKPTDYFHLNNLIEFNELSPIDYVNRDFSKIDVDLMLPLGTTLTYKKGDATWILMDIYDGWYMFILANGNSDIKFYSKKESGKFMGYTFQAFKVRADEFNQIFGFDKATGITPPNKLGILSNVEVVHYDGKFQYQLTSLPRFIVKNISPYFMKLMESVLVCFTSPEPDVVIETIWDREKNIEEEVTEFEIKEIRYPEGTVVSKINMWSGLLDYIPILKLTGEFINKEVIEVRT